MLDLIFLLPEIFFLLCFFFLILYTGVLYYKLRISIVMNCIFLLGYGGVLYLYLITSGACFDAAIMSFHMCNDSLIFFIKIISVFLFLFILWLFGVYFFSEKVGAPEPILLLALFF